MQRALVSRAIAWAARQEDRIISQGARLEGTYLAIADAVGVPQPDKVRWLQLDALPCPDDPELLEAARMCGLDLSAGAGIAIGNGICVKKGHASMRILKHELRHVSQCQKMGGLEAFLEEYFRQCLSHSYYDAPFERDARTAEQLPLNPPSMGRA